METALKQRLVGAAVLVALAVIFLPMLIKGPAPESGISDVPLKLPDAPQGEFETRELPLVTPGAVGANGATGAQITPASSVATDTTPADGMLPAATAGGDYAVSFGSYASRADGQRVIDALKASQLPAYQDAVPASGGRTLFRVRIGPFATQADAEAARLRAAHVRDDVGAKVVVLDAESPAASATTAAATPATSVSVPQPLGTAAASAATPTPLPQTKPAAATPSVTKPVAAAPQAPTAPAPVAPKPATPKPAAASVGFAVQLGAFGNADEANRLRDRARAAGFSAFVEQVQTDKGTLSRVRVGPVAGRADADGLRAQVSAKLGVNGIVRPHP